MRREDIPFPFPFSLSLSCWWFGSYLYIRSLDDDEGMIIVLGKTRLIFFFGVCDMCILLFICPFFLACGSGWWC